MWKKYFQKRYDIFYFNEYSLSIDCNPVYNVLYVSILYYNKTLYSGEHVCKYHKRHPISSTFGFKL